MKNILKSVFALALLVVMGCDRTEAPVYNGGDFIAFKGNIVTVAESDPSFGITITGTKPGLSSGLSFEGSAIIGQDFTVDTQTVTVGDEYTTTLTITPIDNSVVDGILEATITLTEGGFPGGAAGKVYTVRFLDDDCPIDLAADWVGTYSIGDEFIGGGNAGIGLDDFGLLTGTVTLAVDPSDPRGYTAIISSETGLNLQAPVKVVFEPCPKTMTHEGYDISGGLAGAVGGAGVGSFDPTNFTITLVANALGGYGGPHELYLTKQ